MINIFRSPTFLKYPLIDELDNPEEYAHHQVTIIREAVDLAFDLIMQLTNVVQVTNMSADFPVAEFLIDHEIFKSKHCTFLPLPSVRFNASFHYY